MMTDLLGKTSNYYLPYEYEQFFRKVGVLNKVRNNKKITYYNVSASFDIETTSFYSSQLEKRSIMYEWTLCINGVVMVGRYWSEFLDVYMNIVEWYDLSEYKRMIIYVHNLSFEFQFLRNRIDWLNVFSIDSRKPIQALTVEGIEFRCSYLLSGYSLKNLSNQLNKYRVKKMVGDLDYSLIRHSATPLTEKEIGYCINDVLVVVAYIQETIERLGNITKIPLTKTGYVRRYCRNQCLYDKTVKDNKKYHKYRELMNNLTLDSKTYKQLKKAFAGGFTHASAFNSGLLMENVGSFDFCSEYPYVMVSEEFPMSSPEYIKINSVEELNRNINKYCCLFDIEFFELESEIPYEHYISKSHCTELEDHIEDNGRIVSAKYLKTTITEQDFLIIRKYYNWSKVIITNFCRFRKQYLPKDFVLSILKLYVDKTTLKGIEGKELEYMQSKEQLNSCYGMIVTDICRDEIIYEDEWFSEKPDIEKAISKYNKSVKRFLYYPWGVWVTAYARRNLFTGILEFDSDYVYSDTDSVKAINVDKHMDYINRYNKNVIKKLEKAMDYHGIDIEMTRPKNKKGEVKQLGIWEFEHTYTRFKTLGAKRYMTECDGKISMTVSGVNKEKAIPYLLEEYGSENIFEMFEENLSIPSQYTGKMTHTYIDCEIDGIITDYLGNQAPYQEYSGVHLENAKYDLSLSQQYVNYLLGIRETKY